MADTDNGQDEALADDPVADFDADTDVAQFDSAETEAEPTGQDGGDADGEGVTDGIDDPELEAIKARVKEMEEEAEKLKEMQSAVDMKMNMTSPTPSAFPSIEEKIEADNRSVYVGSVDYHATAEELEQHFHGCGSINRVTIQCDKFTGHPKGFAYIEFADKDSVTTSLALDDSLFRGRQIKVFAKRTNRPGISTTNRGRRGRRGSGGYRGGGGYAGGGYGGYSPRPRGRGGYRGRRAFYSPY